MTVYSFDEFRADTMRGSLHGPNGALITLRPKVFALLCHLLEQPGELYTREQLLNAVWPGLIVTDDSLTQCISDLRRGLGDRAAHVLRTIPRRGYILSAEVRHEAAAADTRPPPPPGRSIQVAERRDTVIVGPFSAANGHAASAQVIGALATDITAELTQFEELRVLTAGDREAMYRIVGEARQAGAAIRSTIRIEDARDSGALWAERLDQPAADPAGLPIAIVVTLAARIALRLDQASLRRARTKPAEALTARELCLLGQDVHHRGTKGDAAAARDLFAKASAVDPGYAVAFAWEAFTEMRTVTHGWAEDDGPAKARALKLARRAVELEPASPLCLSAIAFALALDGQWNEAVEVARNTLASGRPAAYGTRTACAEVLAAAGRPEEAADAVRRSFALDPHAPPRAHAVLGRALVLAGRPEEALPELRRCTALIPDYAPSLRTAVVAAVETGRLDEAAAALREVTRLTPNWLPTAGPVFWFLRRPEDIERFERAFAAAARYASPNGSNVIPFRGSAS